MARAEILMYERASKIGNLEKMANLVGISHQQLANIETHRKGTTEDTANKIAEVLGMGFKDLFEFVQVEASK